ncbi:ead/Ea22-like family protein [Escherichia coli]|nr:ead/Ea22-like family protein [Escherichia coli]
MSKIDFQALREKAEKATKGSYIVGHTSVNQHGNLTGVFVCQKWKGEPGGVIAECHVNCLVETDAQAYANAEFIAEVNPATMLALLDEREAQNKRIAELEKIATDYALKFQKAQDALKHVVLMRKSEQEAADNNLIDSECHVAELEEALRDKQALLEASEKRNAKLQSENAYIRNRYINRKYAPIDEKLMALHKWFWEQSEAERAAGIRIKGDAGEQNDEKP